MNFKKLFVGGLPFVYSNEELRALFVSLGSVVSAEMVYDPDRDRTRGFGFVEMSTPEEAQAAIAKLNGQQLGEKKIFVTEAREKKPSNPNKTPGENRFGGSRFRKVGRPESGSPPSASGPVNPYAVPPPQTRPPLNETPRTPGAFGRFKKREFPGQDAPRGKFGFRDRGPRPIVGHPRSGGSPARPFRSRDDRGARPDASGRPFRSRDDRGARPDARGRPPRSGSGFAPRPSPWRPRDPNKNSFSAPRDPNKNSFSAPRAPSADRWDFGPPRERKPFKSGGKTGNGGPRPVHSDSRPSEGRPPKKDFWKKFEKKRDR